MRRKLSLLLLLVLSLLSPLCAKQGETFALVLSGGGAKGYAHIAVLQELDRRGIVPDIVIGTSMGALIGGLYAAGHTGDEILEICQNTDINALISKPYSVELEKVIESPFMTHNKNLARFSFGAAGIASSGGLIDDKALISCLSRLVIKQMETEDFDDLSIPFRAVTTDITTGKRVVLGSGSLPMAMRASMSIPIIFAPVPLADGGYGIDGGFTSNLPSDVARELGYDVVLAVDVNDDLNLHGKKDPDLSSLIGALDTFADYLSSQGVDKLYDLCDYVLVPKTENTLDYNAVDIMVAAGEEAVEAGQAVFDELEQRVGGGRTRPLYRDIEPEVIRKVSAPDLSDAEQLKLESYIGMPVVAETIEDLEEDLDLIRMHARLKSVGYEFKDGLLSITTEPYARRYGEVGIGLGGSVGVRYDGDDPYFVFQPDFELSGSLFMTSGLELSFGLGFDKGLRLDGGLSSPLMSSSYVYGNLALKYGQLSWATIPGTNSHEFGNDVSVGFIAGFGQMPDKRMRWDALLGLDYTHLSEIKDTDDMDNLYVFGGASFVYDGYEEGNRKSNGLDASVTLTAGIDVPDPALGYVLDADLSGVFGGSVAKFFFQLEANSVRRPLELAEAYRVTKIGRMTTDNLSALCGAAFPLPQKTYVAAGVFAELTDPDADERVHDKWSGSDFVPFSMIDPDGFDFGGYLGGGIATSFGRIFAELYVSTYPGFSLLVGVK